MNNQACSEIARTLARQGYSRQYINRLVEELEDHACCVMAENRHESVDADRDDSCVGASRVGVQARSNLEFSEPLQAVQTLPETRPEVAWSNALAAQTSGNSGSPPPVENTGARLQRRLGGAAEIVAAVNAYPALQPVLTRFPGLLCVVVPACLLCVTALLSVEVGSALAGPATGHASTWIPWLIQALSVWQVGVPVLAAFGLAVWAAPRQWLYWQCCGLAILSLSSMFQVEMVYCESSQSVACFPLWQFSWPQLLCVGGIGAAVNLAFGLHGLCRSSSSAPLALFAEGQAYEPG